MLLIGAYLFVCGSASGQARSRKLATNINHPAINNFAPFISLDGNSMVFLSDVGEDNTITMRYTTREGVNWKEPVVLPKTVNNKLNFMKGYSLSPDGTTLYLTNIRGNGMGGFDLYASELRGRLWGDPVNMLLPANSKGHDACPSLSLDGSQMFYMRCETMDFEKAGGCKLMMMSKKSNGRWDDPVELPAHINTGNSQTPRILGDSESLVFASDRLQPNKGGMDLYLTRFVNGSWSKPAALDFANTPADDQYVSATSSGMYLVKEVKGQHSSELVELLFPPEFRPKGTLRVDGKVSGPTDPSAAFITVYNVNDQSKVFSTRPNADGSFVAYMNFGGLYDLSIEPEKDNFTFVSKTFDLRGEDLSMMAKVDATLSAVVAGDAIDVEGVAFEPGASSIHPSAAQELRRLLRLIEGNPENSFSIEVTLLGILVDSIRSTPDLTEILRDTVKIPVTYWIDSVTMATRDSTVVTTRYHNDRTLQQAKALENYLINKGVSPGRLASSGKALPEAILEKRKTLVRIIVH
ncbi:MAG: hypothetical protein SH819_08935 [Cytophagales bacterium]|nr:hypothetical protein [Cytophagales bacterium]